MRGVGAAAGGGAARQWKGRGEGVAGARLAGLEVACIACIAVAGVHTWFSSPMLDLIEEDQFRTVSCIMQSTVRTLHRSVVRVSSK